MSNLIANYPYTVSLLLFAIGMYIVVTRRNLMRKILGLNIMETSVFLFFIAMGNLRGGRAPIMTPPGSPEAVYVNPLPSALILTGIVVSVSVTAFALSLMVKLHRYYKTIDKDKILALDYESQRGECS